MGQIYNFTNNNEMKEQGHCSFEAIRKDVIFDEASNYAYVLSVFRKAFSGYIFY